jgi:murein DD-endopeptidase MepM/ murein hydrolase activator NlpD
MLRLTFNILALVLAVPLCCGLTLGSANPDSSIQTNDQKDLRTTTSRPGDTISKIAHRFGISPSELARLNNLTESGRIPKGTKIYLPESSTTTSTQPGEVVGNRITLSDGYSFEADEVWRQGEEVWYRKGNITSRVPEAVKSVTPIMKAKTVPVKEPEASSPAQKAPLAVWIHLIDGAKFRVDDVQETSDGAWYNRDKISRFIEKERIASIEREEVRPGRPSSPKADWTSGNPTIDTLIRSSGERYGVDPYLVFLVIEKESRFRVRALSPKGAQGLMQLMPATARRLGVTKPFDPAQNIKGGTRYLRELMDMFGGEVNLVLASYNAGEGAVLKYGRNVPPYRETRDYVKTIGKRYGLSGRKESADNDVPSPQR